MKNSENKFARIFENDLNGLDDAFCFPFIIIDAVRSNPFGLVLGVWLCTVFRMNN